MPSPLEKAQALKSEVIEEKNNQDELSRKSKVNKTQTELDNERSIKKDFSDKINDAKDRENQIRKELGVLTDERKQSKSEGKAAASELRKDEPGQAILNNPELREKVFGETIARLKELRDAINPNLVELKEISRKTNEEREKFRKAKQKRLDAFLLEHPEIAKIQQQFGNFEVQRSYINKELEGLESLLNIEKYKPYWDDEIKFDGNRNNEITDVNLQNTLDKLDAELDIGRKENHDYQETIVKRKKGFFQKQESFDKETEIMWKDYQERQNKLDSRIFHGDFGKQEINRIKEGIENIADNYLRKLVNFSDSKVEFVKKMKTVRGLLEAYRSKLHIDIDKLKLSEEEQLLIDLNNELWSS